MTKQNRYQRRFARAVFTQQAQHLAGLQAQGNVVVGHQRAEALGDVLNM